MYKVGRLGDNAPIVDIEGSLVAELQKLDLTLNEARILIFLMTHGHSSASDWVLGEKTVITTFLTCIVPGWNVPSR